MTRVDVPEVRRRHEAADTRQSLAWNHDESLGGVLRGIEDALGSVTGHEVFDRISSLLEQAQTITLDAMAESTREVDEAVADFDRVDEELGRIEDALLILETTGPSDPLRKEWAQSILDGWTWSWLDFLAHHSSASSSVSDPFADCRILVDSDGIEWVNRADLAERFPQPVVE